jgi:hypothetical protein
MPETMTTPDWRTLPPGRELDRLIFERVMGFDPAWWTDDWAGHHVEANGQTWHIARADDYSTEMAAAWQVVDKLRESDWLVVIKAMPAGIPFLFDDGDRDLKLHREAFVSLTYVGWQRPDAPEAAHRRHFANNPMQAADTVPHAICRAALAAVESAHA